MESERMNICHSLTIWVKVMPLRRHASHTCNEFVLLTVKFLAVLEHLLEQILLF